MMPEFGRWASAVIAGDQDLIALWVDVSAKLSPVSPAALEPNRTQALSLLSCLTIVRRQDVGEQLHAKR